MAISYDKATFMFGGEDIHVSTCSVFTYGVPTMSKWSTVGYFHYEDVKWARLQNSLPRANPGNGGNAPVARVCRLRLRKVTPAEWTEDPYLVAMILSVAQ